tara:strand:- start:35 stop:268 length:234 start_codon:yes stop_codon:yes gene_type:complete
MGFIIMLDLTHTTVLKYRNYRILNEILCEAIESVIDSLNIDGDKMEPAVARALSKEYRLLNETKKQLAVTELYFAED